MGENAAIDSGAARDGCRHVERQGVRRGGFGQSRRRAGTEFDGGFGEVRGGIEDGKLKITLVKNRGRFLNFRMFINYVQLN